MITKLENRSLLKITGDDSHSFLQSQFTNDISKINPNEIQLNAYCQHQGKIMALLWVFARDNSLYISLPSDLKELVLSKLNMFKLMSRVDIEDISSITNQYGLIDETCNDCFKIRNNLFFHVSNKILGTNCNFDLWEKACIDNNLPEIYSSTSEQLTPQVLNLDINESGVSFSKGCYPGQEVVARMHYLGKPKRRLFRFVSKFKLSVGDSIHAKDSKSIKPSGKVIRTVKIDQKYYFLGTLETSHVEDPIYLGNDINKSFDIINE